MQITLNDVYWAISTWNPQFVCEVIIPVLTGLLN